jgi:hypothetical protein
VLLLAAVPATPAAAAGGFDRGWGLVS